MKPLTILCRTLSLSILLLACNKVAAIPMVDATATPIGGGAFHYEFSVTDDSSADLILVSIVDAPLGDPLIAASLSAPAGFLASYDAGLGLLDFIADTAVFFPLGTISGFAFDSAFGPGANFNLFEAYPLSDFPIPLAGTVNITQVAGIPEPGILALFLAGFTALRFRAVTAATDGQGRRQP